MILDRERPLIRVRSSVRVTDSLLFGLINNQKP
jgi:hypothetical protein